MNCIPYEVPFNNKLIKSDVNKRLDLLVVLVSSRDDGTFFTTTS